MSLTEEYRRQFAWRDWGRALSLCPISPGQSVLDLGCGPGDIAAELSRRKTRVTGVDRDSGLLAAARLRCPECTFERQDLNQLQLDHGAFDGLWCSFAPAYFTDFARTLSGWLPFLKSTAWICVIDIDDLLAHEPLSDATRRKIEGFYDEAFNSGRHDFRIGGKLEGILGNAGFHGTASHLEDKELSFNGPGDPEIIKAWGNRLDRMGGLKDFLKGDFAAFKEEFVSCLSSKAHVSRCRVVCCVGRRP